MTVPGARAARGPRKRRPLAYETKLWLLALWAGAPALIVAIIGVWRSGSSSRTQWTLTLVMVGVWWVTALVLREKIIRPLQTIANLLAALRDEDFSIRARGGRYGDAMGELIQELNALGQTLRDQRFGALEATALLRSVMSEIEVAVFTFDPEHRLALINRAGERLLAQPAERLLGRRADDLGLDECLRGETPRTLEVAFPGGIGRWEMRRSAFRQGGAQHQLLVLSDLSRALRQEEQEAWQRLLRVLGHELNNSLAPIKSVAGSMAALMEREPKPADWKEDMQKSLEVISARAESLTRFIQAYTRIARLPQPRLGPVDVAKCVQRVADLESRLRIAVAGGPPTTLQADSDQLEQLLINLLRNAVDASLESEGGVEVSWAKMGSSLEIDIRDEGPGLSSTGNLFVPFFTTKPKGSGIGLVLSRQIAEAHGGRLSLENRADRRGCLARLILPIGG